MGGGSFFDLSVVPVMLEVRATVAHGCGRSLLSDQTPAICGCSPIARRPLRTIPHLSSCCTGAPKPQRDTILGRDGGPSQVASVCPWFVRNSTAPRLPAEF